MPVPTKVINDFVISPGTTASQSRGPMVEALANGTFFVGHQRAFNTDTDANVYRYSALPSSTQFVNSYGPNVSTLFNDGQVSVSSYNDGDFVMAYRRTANPVGSDGGDIYIRYGGQSGFLTNEIAVSTASGAQTRPEVEVFKNGNVLVTWINEATSRIEYAVYNQAGNVVTAPTVLTNMVVNHDASTAFDYKIGTTLLDNGNAVISYFEPEGTSPDSYNIRFSIVSSSGAIITNAVDTNLQGTTEVTALADGRFMVLGNTGFGNKLFQIFNADGTAGTAVTTFPSQFLFNPSAASLLDGRIIIVGSTGGNVVGAIYRPDGTADGGVFTISATPNNASAPSVDVLADGRFVVSWSSTANNGSVLASVWDPRETGVTLNGTSDDDSYVGSNFADTMVLGAGNDTAWGGSGNDTLFGNAGTDTLLGDAGNDVLNGGAGADSLDGGDGTDTVSYANAGSGVYFLAGDTANATGEARGDVLTSIENIIGSNFADAIGLGSGDNRVDGGAGNDQLFGQDGNDVLIGGIGADILNGGNGTQDIASYENATAGVYVLFNDLGGSSGEAAGDTFIGIEGLRGGIYNDFLGMDAGNNLIFGGGGDDQMFGQDGNDLLDGGIGADLFNGGNGIDTATYQSAYTGDIYLLAGDFGNAYGDGRGDSYVSIENIIGSNFRDIIGIGEGDNRVEGRGGNDWLWGQGGNDVLVGGVGADLLDGGTGADTASYEGAAGGVYVFFGDLGSATGEAAGDSFLSIENLTGGAFDDILGWDNGNNVIDGGGGNDQLFGQGGNDILIGGAGNDTLNGGAGSDFYTYNATNFGTDTITAFEDGLDIIDFRGSGITFANISIGAGVGGVLVTHATGSVLLGGVTISQITAADFLF